MATTNDITTHTMESPTMQAIAENLEPIRYRLARKSDGTLVLQSTYWRMTRGDKIDYGWYDMETVDLR